MTLKQKFFDIYTSYYKKSNKLDKMVEVADNYAIDFADWLNTDWTTDERWTIIVDEKELLEIFKKEKGL